MNKNIVIVHYNTPYLTECLVRSINLLVKDAVIYIFDNSDKEPFSAEFDNVIIFDNTKGYIINFDKWLEKYDRKEKSPGSVNSWASAKHCYSVEKCMELINDNFMLLDSDILLKKDISELFDENSIYVGETIYQPNSAIKRVLPFLCYINVKMCKEKNVHYFDHDYMHGLAYNKNNMNSDKYDTGAGFYLHASKFNHKEISLSEYIMHYGHGSWNKKGVVQQFNSTEWLNIHKSLWCPIANKKVVYTCITGKYDSLIEPKVISDGFDYVCFTDNENFSSQVWDIRPLPKEVSDLSDVKKQRFIKISPHKFLSNYDLSIWVDGNVELKGDLNTFVSKNIDENISIYVPEHPKRNCIYSEASAVISMKKDKKEIVDEQINRYKSENFPTKYGLLQSNILLRKHNNDDCIRLMETWSNEVLKGSHRDQLSFNYALWKNNDIKIKYINKLIYKSEWFYWNGIHKKAILSFAANTKQETLETKREALRKMIENHRKILTNNISIYQ